jgi:hypothetical protein
MAKDEKFFADQRGGDNAGRRAVVTYLRNAAPSYGSQLSSNDDRLIARLSDNSYGCWKHRSHNLMEEFVTTPTYQVIAASGKEVVQG